jgi:hypothetical protein
MASVPILSGPPAPKRGYRRGPSFRLGHVIHIFDYLPPMAMQSLDLITDKPTSAWLPICGRCFQGLGDNPFDGKPGQLRPLPLENKAFCFRCGRRCHPVD